MTHLMDTHRTEARLREAAEWAYQLARIGVFDLEPAGQPAAHRLQIRTPYQQRLVDRLEAAEQTLAQYREVMFACDALEYVRLPEPRESAGS